MCSEAERAPPLPPPAQLIFIYQMKGMQQQEEEEEREEEEWRHASVPSANTYKEKVLDRDLPATSTQT